MPTRYLEIVNPKSRWAAWAWSPVIMLRVALVITYLLYVYAAAIAGSAGVPVLTMTAPDWYTGWWANLLAVTSLAAAVGSVADRLQWLEKWATLGLSALLLAYIGGLNAVGFVEGDINRQFIGAIALIAGVLPITRFVYLAAQSGKKRHVPVAESR